MCQLMTRLSLGLTLLAVGLAGCNHTPIIGPRGQTTTEVVPTKPPDAAALVEYLNGNSARVQAVQCSRLAIDCKQGRNAIGLDGLLVCQKPRELRLRAMVVGSPAVDIGSNNDEFWYWIKQANPPYVFHCAYNELSTGRVDLPFPFQPDMVVAALGIADYDPKAQYEVRDNPQAKYLELIQNTVSAQGQQVQRVTVFNRSTVKAPQPQVIAHVLRDTKGKLICQATVHEVRADKATGAVLPYKVTLEWPSQELKMTMTMPDLQVVNLTPERAGKLFSRADLTTYDAYDLARRSVDNPGGIRRAGTLPPATRR